MKNLIFALLVLVSAVSCSFSDSGYIAARAVRLTGQKGSCSGTQIRTQTGTDYVLSAGHCAILADEKGQIWVESEGRRPIPRRILEVDPNSDLLLLEGLPGLRGIALAKEDAKRGDRLIAVTHGAGLESYREEGILVQRMVLQVPEFVIISSADEARCNLPKYKKVEYATFFGPVAVCALSVDSYLARINGIVGGSSGGTTLNSSGELVGVVFASAGNAFAGIIPLSSILRFVDGY